MKKYHEHLRWLKSLSPNTVTDAARELSAATPEKVWPDGFPSSIDPKLLLVGVSYGNSPDDSSERVRQETGNYFKSYPCAIKDSSSHFYYPDGKRYWYKMRWLSHSYFRYFCDSISEIEALSLTTHINLGTGCAGAASIRDVDQPYVAWASQLINRTHNPDLVVLFGLANIMKNVTVSQWWNHQAGINIDWRVPDRTLDFIYNGRKYKYRAWSVVNANGHKIKFVIWPNHPSRPPFVSFEIWKRSVEEFLGWIDSV